MNTPTVNIVVLNWNGFKDTSELLESLSKIIYRNYRIIVVDNNSHQNESERLRNSYGKAIHIISCKENLGFAGGNNIGIKYSLQDNADYILLLNNDTIVQPDFLEILLRKFESDERAGIIAPRINYYDKPDNIWTEGGKISWLRGSGFAYCDKLETQVELVDKSVSFVSGCCMLIKAEVILKVGPFDENYFLYTEDTDLCLRTIRAGYKIYVVPQSKIFHKVSSSTRTSHSILPLYYVTRNRLYFAKKNFKYTYLLTVTYIFLAMTLKSFIWAASGNTNRINAVYKAFKDFFHGKMGKTERKFFRISK
jgi:GT2 family glycosyltransferase